MAKDLSPAKCILLTIHYASEGNIKALQSLTRSRADDLNPELILRVLLTYLPESIEPRAYTKYVSDVTSEIPNDVERDNSDLDIDISPVNDIDEAQARRRVKRLKLLEIQPPDYPADAPEDILTQFLCHRAYRIDAEVGLLNLIPQLVEPFLEHRAFLRTWHISVVLPLLRLQFEYYPEEKSQEMGLQQFQKLDGKESVDFLMANASRAEHPENNEVARDIKGLVGPWMYGHSGQKRRKLSHQREPEQVDGGAQSPEPSEGDTPEHEWIHMYRWMVTRSQENFPLITRAIENWDGPGEVDLGGFNAELGDQNLDEDTQGPLEAQYAQAAIASCYTVESDSEETVHNAHAILARLSRLLDFDPPLGLDAPMESLPKIEGLVSWILDTETRFALDPDALLKPGHPLTSPRLETYAFLQAIIYSAYQFSTMNYPISLVNVVKLHLDAPAEEQLAVLKKVLHGLSKSGAKREETLWVADRAKLMWLWNWGMKDNDSKETSGAGVLGKVPRQELEEEVLQCLVESGCLDLAITMYLKSSVELLPRERIAQIVLIKTMEAYDSASNGNRTRGGMKKANDIVSTFRPYFPQSIGLRQASSLISATHALSFYSLTLQHGVPFQPVSIRVNQDPISLISKVLEQNPSSYTQLDDLISIAQNLVSAGLPQREKSNEPSEDSDELDANRKNAERRVTLMAIEQALHEDDFETAYSYIVSRLTPSGADIEAPKDTARKSRQHGRNISNSSTSSKSGGSQDDISWRAAFLAGRYRPATSSPPSLRRLEQRTELLSLALLLAPVSALPEILSAWRKCEEETTALQLSQQQAEEEIDDRADKRQSLDAIPGNFTVDSEQPALLYNQKRREMGRMTGKAGGDEAPMSMFDLTRSAAQAFSKNAFPLRGATRPSSSSYDAGALDSSVESLGSNRGMETQSRTRKRDMVTSAVSGGLASGLGWMLGATPVSQHRPEEH